MSDYSPTWKKPSDVMKNRCRRSLVSNTSLDSVNNAKPRRASVSASNSGKRKNPFGCSSPSPVKQLHLDDTFIKTLPDDCSSSLEMKDNSQFQVSKNIPDSDKWQRMNSVNGKKGISNLTESDGIPLFECLTDYDMKNSQTSFSAPVVAGVRAEVDDRQNQLLTSEDLTRYAKTELSNVDIERQNQTYPIDWSLRTKVRYVSSVPFSCSSLLRSADASQGMNAFVRNMAEESLVKLQDDDEGVAKQQFQRHLMFWVYPNIPWLPTFPRIINTVKQFQPGVGMADDIRKALQEDWLESINAAYQNVRAGVCPYLYVCCHHLTILFRAAVGSRSQMSALVTPTTRGLRECLKAEGIEFRLPLHEQSQTLQPTQVLSKETSQSDFNEIPESGRDREDNDEDETLMDDCAVNWLEELGLDRRQYRSVEPSKVKDQRDGYRDIDHRPESTVLVEGVTNTQAFFNYLLNWSSLISSTGPQAGLPPTILSPVAFKGSTLQSLKVRQGSILHSDSQGQQKPAHSVEITGPILPQSLAGLSRLFSQTQPEFMATFVVHEPTVPFNADIGNSRSDDTSQAHIESVFGAAVHMACLGKVAVRDVVYERGTFSWSAY